MENKQETVAYSHKVVASLILCELLELSFWTGTGMSHIASRKCQSWVIFAPRLGLSWVIFRLDLAWVIFTHRMGLAWVIFAP